MVLLCKLKGVSYYSGDIDKLKEGQSVLLKIDEDSEYDNKPLLCTNSSGKTLGFIAKEQKVEALKIIVKEYKASVHKIHLWDGPTGVTIKLESDI